MNNTLVACSWESCWPGRQELKMESEFSTSADSANNSSTPHCTIIAANVLIFFKNYNNMWTSELPCCFCHQNSHTSADISSMTFCCRKPLKRKLTQILLTMHYKV